MGKRKRSHSREKYRSIRKKLKKLEEKLQQCRSSSTSSSDSIPHYEEDGNDIRDQEEPAYESPDVEANLGEKHVLLSSSPTVQSAVVGEAMTLDSIVPDKAEEVLDPEILMILGEDPTIQKQFGEDLHKDIAARWAHILTNGLPKDIKADLISQYLPAENCSSMKPPKLNLEIEAALSNLNIKKDMFSQSKQNQLSSCLAAIGKVLNWALSPSKDTLPQVQEIVKPLSDAGRLLCDCHFRESQSRRYAIINNLNRQTRDIVKNTKIDETLFGANLSEHLKSSKAISKSGLEMKTVVQRTPYRPPTTQNQRGALNSKGASRAAAGEPRQNPAPRKPVAPSRDRRTDLFRQNRTHSARQKTRRR